MPLERPEPELVESFLHLVEAVFIDKIISDGAFQITGESFVLYSIFPVHQFEMGTSDEAVASQFVNPENHIAYDVHFNDYTGMAQGWITFTGLDATQLFAMDSIESARTYMNDLYQEVMSKELDADQMLVLLSNASYVNRLAPVPYYQALQNPLNIHGRGKGKKFICIPASTADVEDLGRAKMFGQGL